MPFSSGVYTLPNPALVTGEVVSATENNSTRNDIATAFNLTFLRNGTSTATANLPMGGYKLTGLGVATTSGDALSYAQAATVSSLTASSITDSGNLTFTGTGNRILGDFSNATASNRVAIQTTATDGITAVGVIPNGTGAQASVNVWNNSSLVAASGLNLTVTSTEASLRSNITDSGSTLLPLTIHTGGSERMRIDTSGNVGIGASSPAYLLHLSQNGNTTAFISATNTGTNSAGLTIENAGQRNWNIWADRSTDTFRIGNNLRAVTNLVIDSSGNVGIGTSSPASYGKLCSFTANADATDMLYLQRASSGTLRVRSPSGGVVLVGSPFADAVGFETNATERMRIDSSGNVGIGTSSPAAKIHVQGALYRNTTANNATEQGLVYSSGASQFAGIYFSNTFASDYNTNLILATSNSVAGATERMRIDSSGNLLVGTTSAWTSTKCQIGLSDTAIALVLKNDTVANNNSLLFGVKAGSTNNTSQVYIEFAYNSGANGNGAIAGNGDSQCTFISRSDARLKENITDLPDQLQNICNLHPVEFDYKDTGNRQIGFIAQDVQQVYPDLVSENDAGMLMLGGMDKTTARLVKAIQELKAELDATKAEVAALKGA